MKSAKACSTIKAQKRSIRKFALKQKTNTFTIIAMKFVREQKMRRKSSPHHIWTMRMQQVRRAYELGMTMGILGQLERRGALLFCRHPGRRTRAAHSSPTHTDSEIKVGYTWQDRSSIVFQK